MFIFFSEKKNIVLIYFIINKLSKYCVDYLTQPFHFLMKKNQFVPILTSLLISLILSTTTKFTNGSPLCGIDTRLFELTSNTTEQSNQIYYSFMIYPNCDITFKNSIITITFSNLSSLGEVYGNEPVPNNPENRTNPYVTWYKNCNPSNPSDSNSESVCILNNSDVAGILVVISYDNFHLLSAPTLQDFVDDLALHYITIEIENQDPNDEPYTLSEDVYLDTTLYTPLVSMVYDEVVPEMNDHRIPDDFYTSYLNCSNHSQCHTPCSKNVCFSGYCSQNSTQRVYLSNTVICRPANGSCDVEEKCTGNATECPTDGVKNEFQICRESEGDCDPEELCDGSSKDCPNNLLETSGTICRTASGICEMEGVCDGVSPSCPSVTYYDFFTRMDPCRESTGICDNPEYCDGTQADCPNDDYADTFTICRNTIGACDLTEYCSGLSPLCSNNTLASSDTVCRAAAGACDVAENCTGHSAFCPVDLYKSNNVVCRPVNRSSVDNTTCDVEEKCTGTGPQCPQDGFLSSGTVCRPKISNTCDIDERCTGTSSHCPPNLNRGFIYMYQCRHNLYVCGVRNIVIELKIPFVVSNRNNFRFLNRSFTEVRNVYYLEWPTCMIQCYEESELCSHNDQTATVHIIEASCLDGDTNFAQLPPPSALSAPHSMRLTKEDGLNNEKQTMDYTTTQTTQLSHLKEAIIRRKNHKNTAAHNHANEKAKVPTSHSHVNVKEIPNHHTHSQKRAIVSATWNFLALRTITTTTHTNETHCPLWLENEWINPVYYNVTDDSSLSNNIGQQTSSSNNVIYSLLVVLGTLCVVLIF